MEANKDEAIKCASIARRYFSSGDVEKARKWCLKALRLHSAVDIHGMEQLVNRKQTPPASRRARTFESNRSTSPGRCENDTEKCSEQTFSKAQTEAVRKVLACKDYYELLGVDKDSTEDEIKRAYKGLALKFHPDKNRAPGATEAFKKIGNAFNVLTNPEKRRRYDQFGTEEEIPRITRAHRHGDAFFQYDGDPFMMFFNNSFPFAQVYRNQQRRAASAESERENNHFVYLQLLPLIILFALSFLGNLFIKEPYYNLARSSKYPVERHTTQHSVPYYVKPNFKEDFTGPLRTLEAQIEEDFGNNLRYRCIRERDAKENLIFRARYYGDEGYERATKIPLPHCDRYMQMFGG